MEPVSYWKWGLTGTSVPGRIKFPGESGFNQTLKLPHHYYYYHIIMELAVLGQFYSFLQCVSCNFLHLQSFALSEFHH